MNKKTFQAALSATIPVMLGYLSIGIAFGVMLQTQAGYNFLWAGGMSVIIYAGSMQYLAVDLLARGAGLLEVVVMTLLVNSRHMVYGLSMLTKFKGMGKRKWYMIFSLTDETYALLSSARVPVGVEPKSYYFTIALLDQSYWIMGSLIGAVAGSLIPFSTQGIDFAMTALFVVICTDQWLTYPTRIPAILGAACALVALILVGASNMLIPAMLALILIFFIGRKQIEPKFDVMKTANGQEG